MAASRFVDRLVETKAISNYQALHLKILFRLNHIDKQFKAGEYLFPATLRPNRMLLMLVRGDVVQYKVILIEGWTFKEMRAALDADPVLAHSFHGLTDSEVMAALGQANHLPEGRFFPDTYFFSRGFSDKDVLVRALHKMDAHLQTLWAERDSNVSLDSPYEGLILASLIEKESGFAEERPLISGVFQKRLKQKMRLQCDPTVIYGLGTSYSGKLTSQDLRVDSPYNTYLHAGLPPTPIGAPSLNALQAAFHPKETDALYFVSKGNGQHYFSPTLEAHTKAIEQIKQGGFHE